MMSSRCLTLPFLIVFLWRIHRSEEGCYDHLFKKEMMSNLSVNHMIRLERTNSTQDDAVVVECTLKRWCDGTSRESHICHILEDCFDPQLPEGMCNSNALNAVGHSPSGPEMISVSDFNCLTGQVKGIPLEDCPKNETFYQCYQKAPITTPPPTTASNQPQLTTTTTLAPVKEPTTAMAATSLLTSTGTQTASEIGQDPPLTTASNQPQLTTLTTTLAPITTAMAATSLLTSTRKQTASANVRDKRTQEVTMPTALGISLIVNVILCLVCLYLLYSRRTYNRQWQPPPALDETSLTGVEVQPTTALPAGGTTAETTQLVQRSHASNGEARHCSFETGASDGDDTYV
ncbi:mucin-2-like [Centroberyx affinis]|uniref:mucin-2-like n=1 Tax=Centroberyx affinis TaxID=166261 RepID=UPI003A5C1D9F